MDNKQIQMVFDSMWKKYLALEKEIWELSAKYEENPSEIVRGTIYNLCMIARGFLGDLEYIATKLYTGELLDNFKNNCDAKCNELRDISEKVMLEKTK